MAVLLHRHRRRVRIRPTRKLAEELNGLDLRVLNVGEVVERTEPLARMRIAERWAERVVSIDASASPMTGRCDARGPTGLRRRLVRAEPTTEGPTRIPPPLGCTSLMTRSDLPFSTAHLAAYPPPPTEGALVIVTDASQRAVLVEALRTAGVPAVGVARVSEIEHWPREQIVIADADHVMPLWLDVGAREVIVLARDVHEWNAALARGATGWLQVPVSAIALAALAVGRQVTRRSM